MKNKVSWYLVIYFILTPTTLSWSQRLQHAYRGFIHTYEKRFTLEKGQELTVVVQNVGEKGVVSVESRNSLQITQGGNPNEVTLKACVLVFNGNEKAIFDVLKLQDTVALADADVHLQDNTLTIDGRGSLNRRPVIHISVPPGMKLTLYVDDKLFRSGPFSRSMMIQNGEIVASTFGYQFHMAFMQAVGMVPTHPDAIQYNPDTDTYTVPWETLKALARRTVTPVYSVTNDEGVHPSVRRWAALRVTVDEDEMVSEVKYAGGNRGLAEAAIEAVSQWEFEPFSVKDKPVVVKSIIPVILKDGEATFSGSKSF